MKRANTHVRLLGLLCLLLVGIPLLVAGTCFAPDAGHQTAEAFDRIVPGMTRAEDLASIGIDLAGSEVLSGTQIARRLASAGPRVQACIQAGAYCTGYALASGPSGGLLSPILGKPKPAQLVLLVMNGRVIDKVLSQDAPPPRLRVASAAAF